MMKPGIWLFNCKRCDDVQRVVERKRFCECGGASAELNVNNTPVASGASARIFFIDWESYDGIQSGEKRQWSMP